MSKDIWIVEVEKAEKLAEIRCKENDKQMRIKEKKAHATQCDNCGKSPAYYQPYNGMYRPDVFPNGFKKNLCNDCKEKFDAWYYNDTVLEKTVLGPIPQPKKKKHWWNNFSFIKNDIY